MSRRLAKMFAESQPAEARAQDHYVCFLSFGHGRNFNQSPGIATGNEVYIWRRGAQPQVLNGTADGEVIKALPIVARQTERVVQHIIQVASNARAAHTGCFGGQIQGLANYPSLPEQFAVNPRTGLP